MDAHEDCSFTFGEEVLAEAVSKEGGQELERTDAGAGALTELADLEFDD